MSSFSDNAEDGHVDEIELEQGYVTMPNVNVVDEMVNMISVQRNYEFASKAIATHEQLLGRAINDVARVG